MIKQMGNKSEKFKNDCKFERDAKSKVLKYYDENELDSIKYGIIKKTQVLIKTESFIQTSNLNNEEPNAIIQIIEAESKEIIDLTETESLPRSVNKDNRECVLGKQSETAAKNLMEAERPEIIIMDLSKPISNSISVISIESIDSVEDQQINELSVTKSDRTLNKQESIINNDHSAVEEVKSEIVVLPEVKISSELVEPVNEITKIVENRIRSFSSISKKLELFIAKNYNQFGLNLFQHLSHERS